MADKTAPAEDAAVTFHVKSGSQKWTLTLPTSTTTTDLKAKLATDEYANVPATSQRLIYSGKVMKDHDTLATHNVKEGNTMHLVKSAASNQRQNPASQSSTIPNAGTPQSAGVPQNLASGTGNDPLAGLTGARYAGFAGLPSLDSLANPPSPDEMIRRLQDPNFAQQMNEALQNPQMIDMMINSNPQLRALGPQARQMLQSDQFRRMMTNPEALRSMMQLQNAMGMDPFGGLGGGGGQAAFPAPGVTNPAEQTPQQQQQQQGGQNPSLASFANRFDNQTPEQQQATLDMLRQAFPRELGGGTGTNTDQQTTPNPFASLLNLQPTQGNTTGEAGNGQTQNQTQQGTPNGQFHPGLHPLIDAMMFRGPMNDPNRIQNPVHDAFARILADRLANDPSGLFGPNAQIGQDQGGQQDLFSGLFPGLGNYGGTPQPSDNRPPEERYATQLRQLNEMGFHDFDRNITALSRSGGDVNGALEWLFSQP